MIKAAIFDLDGTLVDSEVLWVSAAEGYLADLGHSISHEEALGIIYGRSWLAIYDDIITRFPEIDVSIDEMEEALRAYMLDLQDGRDIIISGSVKLLKRLAREMPVCIVSGSSVNDVVRFVEMLDVASDLEFVLGAEDYSAGKPDPAGFLLAAEKLNVDPRDCVVFEDSEAGVTAAKAAGMRAVALVRQGCPRQNVAAADLIVDDLAYFDPHTL